MKQLKYLFISLAALCMAACTQDDDFLPDGGTDTTGGDLQEYTLTVGIDYGMDGDTRTRATSDTDDQPTRCLMQVYDGNTAVDAVQSGTADGNNYTFTVSLVAGRTYTFCFWADNGEAEITSLKAVPYAIGTVAFAAQATGTPETVSKAITLKHAVAKVSLVTTAATTIAEGEPFTASTQCAETYNVLTGTASGTQDYVTLETSGSFSANAGVTSFYVLPAAETQSITLNAHLLTQTIADVPLAANTHVTLRGDLSDNNGNWAGTPEYYKEVFYNALFDDDGAPKSEQDYFGYYNYYAPDDTVQRILTEVLKTSIRDGENKIITTPWGDSMTLSYVPIYLAITYNGYEMCLYNDNFPGANQYYQITLPDEIH